MVLEVYEQASFNKALCEANSHIAFQSDMFAHLCKKRGMHALEKPRV